MLFNKFFVAILVSVVFAHPINERRSVGESDISGLMVARATTPNKSKPQVVTIGPGGSITDQYRKQNMAPGREKPQLCKTQFDCKCPKAPAGQPSSTFCKKGTCVCNDPEVNKTASFFVNQYLDACAKIGNSKIVQVMKHLIQGVADVKQVVATIAGAVLGPEVKYAIKAAMAIIPDGMDSHITEAVKGQIGKALI